MNKQNSTLFMALVISLLLIIIAQLLDITSAYASPVVIFSTRDHFDSTNGQENAGHSVPTATDLLSELDQICPGEIAIFVHGV
jgi:hypothetical protein